MTGPLADFPVVLEQPVAWADMDSFGHVNNVVYFRYFENARVEYIRRLGWWESLTETGVGPIVASTHAKFRRPVAYPDTLLAGAKLVALAADRFTLRHALVSRKTGELVTDGEAVVVTFDYRAGTKVAIPDDLRRRIEELERGPTRGM
ncbi:MAG TPA: thioesterase family protein [Gemmataceae bacterium]|jgi:acyl-CoA thioester hydrolase|nr:thioesterase family protein [Gemmataceae bacterium]